MQKEGRDHHSIILDLDGPARWRQQRALNTTMKITMTMRVPPRRSHSLTLLRATPPLQHHRFPNWPFSFSVLHPDPYHGTCISIRFADSLTGAPILRIYESIVCYNFYKVANPSLIGEGGLVDELHCKIDPVQEELAILIGWEGFFFLFTRCVESASL